MTVKQVNYTEQMVAVLQAGYDGSAAEEVRDAQIKDLAVEVNRSAASVRAKLTHLGLYVPKAKVEAGKGAVRKATIVAAIAAQLGVAEEAVESLEKANKAVLARIYTALAS